MDIILPIKDFSNTKMTLQFSDLLSNKDYYPWLYENFINIVICCGYNYTINYTDIVDYNCVLINQNIADYKIFNQDYIQSIDILKNILFNMISNNYYNLIWVDELYISAAYAYNRFHFVHPLLIFGIHTGKSDDDVIYECQMFHHEKGNIFCKVSLNELYKGIKNASIYYENGDPYKESVNRTIKSYKYKTPCNLPFNLNTFRLNFEDYLFSKPCSINRRFLYPGTSETAYGLKVYDVIIDLFEDSIISRIDFASLYNFILSKYTLLERLIYINDLFFLNIENEIKQFKEICNDFERIINLNLKYNVINGIRANLLSSDNKFHQSLLKSLKINKDKELLILRSVYRKINGYLNNKNIAESISCSYTYNDNSVSVTINEPAYIKEIIISINSDYPIDILGLIRIGEYSLLTDQKNIKARDISRYLINQKIDKFDYELLSNDGHILHNIRITTTKFEDVYISQETKKIYMIECIKDINGIGNFKYSITGNDPSINLNELNIPENFCYIYLKCSIKSASNTAQLFFNSMEETYYSESKSKLFTVNNTSDSVLYKIDMSDNKLWRQGIMNIRLDPAHHDNTDNKGEFELEYIKINENPPHYCNIEDFNAVQGINCWFYYTYDNGITYREMNWDNNRYVGVNSAKLNITHDIQTSGDKFLTVRRWICPATGQYNVTCSFKQISEGRHTKFYIKRNHKTIAVYNSLFEIADNQNFEDMLDLEIGEYISFEFFNDDENTVEEIKINCLIQKHLQYKAVNIQGQDSIHF